MLPVQVLAVTPLGEANMACVLSLWLEHSLIDASPIAAAAMLCLFGLFSIYPPPSLAQVFLSHCSLFGPISFWGSFFFWFLLS